MEYRYLVLVLVPRPGESHKSFFEDNHARYFLSTSPSCTVPYLVCTGTVPVQVVVPVAYEDDHELIDSQWNDDAGSFFRSTYYLLYEALVHTQLYCSQNATGPQKSSYCTSFLITLSPINPL